MPRRICADTGDMVLVALWIVLSLLAAAAVLLVASVSGGRSDGLAEFLADLRGGLRRDGRDADASVDDGDDEPLEDRFRNGPGHRFEEQGVEQGVDGLFLVGRPAPGYVDLDDLSQTLGLAGQRAARGVALLTRR